MSGGGESSRVRLAASWRERVGAWLERPEMIALGDFLRREKHAGKRIYPPGPRIFAALDTTPFESVKVVILGQDPYHGAGQAHGLA
ncbi:MAG: uracil-DNA glycosylase, partial [Rhodanobacteraceae bacterium]